MVGSGTSKKLSFVALSPLFIFVYSFIVRFPSLKLFQYSFLIPVTVFTFLVLLFLFGNWKVRLDLYFLAFVLMLPFLLLSMMLGAPSMVFPMVVNLFFLLFMLVSNRPYVFLFNRILVWKYRYFFRVLFLIFPVSIIVQKIYPEAFLIYNDIVNYGTDRVVQLNLNGFRYSGLIDGTGTGGSTALAANYFLYVFYEAKISIEKEKAFISFPLLVASMAYLVSIFLMGTSGSLAIFIFLLVLSFSVAGLKQKFVFLFALFVSVLVVYLLAIITSINGLQYIRVFHNSGIEAMLSHASFGNLLSYYEGFETNLAYVISEGGLFGSDSAKGLYEITDIGIINQVHVLGVLGFLSYNLFLFFLLLLSIRGRHVGGTLGNVMFAILVASIAFLFLLQIKEFSHTGNPLLFVIVIMFGVLRCDAMNWAQKKNFFLNTGANWSASPVRREA